jgi:hypothetical protein
VVAVTTRRNRQLVGPDPTPKSPHRRFFLVTDVDSLDGC